MTNVTFGAKIFGLCANLRGWVDWLRIAIGSDTDYIGSLQGFYIVQVRVTYLPLHYLLVFQRARVSTFLVHPYPVLFHCNNIKRGVSWLCDGKYLATGFAQSVQMPITFSSRAFPAAFSPNPTPYLRHVRLPGRQVFSMSLWTHILWRTSPMLANSPSRSRDSIVINFHRKRARATVDGNLMTRGCVGM